MLSSPLFYAIALACLVTAGILAFGIGGVGRGGAEQAKRSNRLMQWRIGAQFVAVVLIAIFVWLRGSG